MPAHSPIGYRFKLVSAFAAFLLWGGWAYCVNSSSTPEARLKSALAQGSASFIITLLMVRFLTYIYQQLPPTPFRLWLPSVITVLCTGSALVLVHVFIGTQHILMTITPALLVAFGFCLFTNRTLYHSGAAHGKNG